MKKLYLNIWSLTVKGIHEIVVHEYMILTVRGIHEIVFDKYMITNS